jgi:uncharacterized protein YjbI with pentapeptide repeats
LQAAELATLLGGECDHGAMAITTCHVDAAGLAPLRAQAHPDVRLTLTDVTGTIDLDGAQLRDVMVIGSRLDRLILHDATVDRVRVAPSSDSVPDAYAKDAVARARIVVSAVDARSCHARTFALLAADIDDLNLRHIRVDDTLDLTFSHARALSMRFADLLRLEAARLTTDGELDMLGARMSQASLAWANLYALNAETASVDRLLSLGNTVIVDRLDGYWFSAGAVVFNGTRVGRMDLSYSHLGLLDIDSALGFESGPIEATGLHVDSIGGDVRAPTRRIDHETDADGAFHSIEAALRNGGRYNEANAVAFEGSWYTAIVAAKLPGELAIGVVGCLVVCFFVAAWCCRAEADDRQNPWKILLCALDIVLPSFVDIGALSAWTDYADAGKEGVEVTITGARRTVAFIMRILGTMAFTYLLLYVTNLRG